MPLLRVPRRVPGRLPLRPAAWLAGLALCGCVHEPKRPLDPTQEIYDPNPTRRAQAAGELGRIGAVDEVPLLIESLDDEDAAVRLTAGRCLKDLTGHDTGYRAYAPPEELRRQVELWRAWHASQGRPAGAGSRP